MILLPSAVNGVFVVHVFGSMELLPKAVCRSAGNAFFHRMYGGSSECERFDLWPGRGHIWSTYCGWAVLLPEDAEKITEDVRS